MLDFKNNQISSKFENFIVLLGNSTKKEINTLGIYALISAVSNAAMIGILNHAADKAEKTGVSFKLLALFSVCMALFYISKRFILKQATKMTEESVFQIRMDIIDSVRNTDLKSLESIGKSNIFTRITHDTNFISQTSAFIVNAIQSAILIFFTLLYILYLSAPVFFLTVLSLSFAVYIFLSKQKKIENELRDASKKETELFDNLNHILDGFKELKMNYKKNNDIVDHFKQINRDGKELKTTTGLKFAVSQMFSETTFYLLIGTVVFILPQFTSLEVNDVTKVTTAILFIIGPIETVVNAFPLFFKANIAIENINKLKEQFKQQVKSDVKTPSVDTFKGFNCIKFIDLEFNYKDKELESTFSVGPINLEIKRNHTYLIKGGNGSGKSSLLKLLSGLYSTNNGRIEIDGKLIEEKEQPSYRELFSIIFTDFHLFDKLYGLTDIDDQKVKELLKKFDLDKKTDFKEGKFTNIDLSTGQKKRLGLIVSLLENKNIYIYDEVAADQDPEFRHYFYTTFLKELKDNDKTIILVSHDDKYFDTADQILHMDNGLVKTV